jgi:small GTP-binding protein
MGAKQSKKTGAAKFVWDDPGPSRVEDFLEVHDLGRSTKDNHTHNSLGLPDDVIGLIATYLDVRDLGRVAQVCKTWRRVSLKDAVWRAMARRLQLQPKPGDDCRAMVIPLVVAPAPTFLRAPPSMRPLGPHSEGREVKIVVMSPDLKPEQNAVGKSALVVRRIQNVFIQEYDPTIEDSFRQQLLIDQQQVMLDILDVAGQTEFAALRDQWLRGCDALVVCSLFSQAGTVEAVEALYDACCRMHEGEKVPLVLVRTKSDLALPFAEASRVLKWAEAHGAAFVNTSALTGINEREPFFIAARLVLGKQRPNVRRYD